MWKGDMKLGLVLTVVGSVLVLLVLFFKPEPFLVLVPGSLVFSGVLVLAAELSVPSQFERTFGFRPPPPKPTYVTLMTRLYVVRANAVRDELTRRAEVLKELCDLEEELRKEYMTVEQVADKREFLRIVQRDIKCAKRHFWWRAHRLAGLCNYKIGNSFKDHLLGAKFGTPVS